MPQIDQGMISVISSYTEKLKESQENDILRLHHGEVKRGQYKGTLRGRFKHFFISLFSEERKTQRQNYLENRTKAESIALGEKLCEDISRRTASPYEVTRPISVRDVATLLEASKAEREQFDQVVSEVLDTVTTPSSVQTPSDAIKDRMQQHLMSRSITNHRQIQLLKEQVESKLQQRAFWRKSRRPIDPRTQKPVSRLKNFKKVRRMAREAIDAKMSTLALLREAEDYAFRQQVTPSARKIERRNQVEGFITAQEPIPSRRQEEILKQIAANTPGAVRKPLAIIAAEQMVEQGISVEAADLPQPDQAAIERGLKQPKGSWDYEIARLLQQGNSKAVVLAEEIRKDQLPLKKLKAFRKAVSEKNQRDTDRAMPWNTGHTRVATRHAKDAISYPETVDGNVQGKEGIVQQTLNMLRAKYPELAESHNNGNMETVREFLNRHVVDRTVSAVRPLTYIRRPLDEDFMTPMAGVKEEQPPVSPSFDLFHPEPEDVDVSGLEGKPSRRDSGIETPDNESVFTGDEDDDVFGLEPSGLPYEAVPEKHSIASNHALANHVAPLGSEELDDEYPSLSSTGEEPTINDLEARAEFDLPDTTNFTPPLSEYNPVESAPPQYDVTDNPANTQTPPDQPPLEANKRTVPSEQEEMPDDISYREEPPELTDEDMKDDEDNDRL